MFRDEGGARVAFSDRDVFHLLDDLASPQLYNAARNVRIALWKLSYALSDVSEEETECTLTRVVQNLATAAFLPVS
ncbi:hypothetical protein M622_10150 [Thauera terpenica 58Eu]|mgnify:CR=1 FL=1|jgi:hypothetical protein|uniref:Uncharacterized protein n=1 Tax=Thauera terpenica 58Eu TaxID=1348657 RepID=S9ZTL4_9RHOO|nr:hypothetical protein [Thauera terpenica]EPZ16872.1 hypothetical protein M622_10150 [Thauera terpenica 58Eu]